MKKFKMLMIAVVTITSAPIFAQVSTNNQTKIIKQRSETMTYTCPMYYSSEMGNSGMYSRIGAALNLSLKEKMKIEVMKINTGSTNYKAANDMSCTLSMSATSLNLSPKEKMKREVMKIYNGNTYICPQCGMNLKEISMGQMMNVVTSDTQVSCLYSRPILNLSPKEKMKRKAAKI